ncbi:hypothetical protein HYR65_03090, partial [Candidatus Azambacteria bacterium]|nr:hypothetical protein [Candidatus Azambacteria bacterium]
MSPRIKKRGVSVVPGKKPRHILSQGGTGRQRNKKKASPKLKTKKLQILEKIKENPIISPRAEHAWEAWQTFNPAAILLEDHVHFLYRAIGPDGVSRVGYAASRDGVTIDERLAYPVYEHPSLKRSFSVASYSSGGSWGGAEDSRIVRVDEEDVLYMTYTACDNGLRVGLTSIKVDDFLNKKWKWKLPVLISPPGEVHKNWLIFPEKIHGRYAILHSIKPDIQVEYRDSLAFDDASYIESSHGGKPRKGCWDKWLRGAGAPPIKTKYGWL